MRVALVSPYSWTYPGGVTRHVGALAHELHARGHDVRVLAPWDTPGRAARLAHRGVDAQPLAPPPWLAPLGTTAGWPFNGALSNLALHPGARGALRGALRAFAPDVVHLHEPVAPWPCWDALDFEDAPLVGTFHTYGTSRLTHGFAALCGSQPRMRRLAVRIAVSDAAAWTGRSFYGGEYRVIPNGIHLPSAAPGPSAGSRHDHPAPGTPPPLRIVFVGRPEARKGLPVLLRAFEALRQEVPATLELVGVTAAATEAEKAVALARADVLVAPSLGGESFGMVLLEAFAAGLPVVCSDLPGYRAVARHGVEALHVAPDDPAALGEALRELALDRRLLARLAGAARGRAEAFGWPRIAAQVERAYSDALAAPADRAADPGAGIARADETIPPPAALRRPAQVSRDRAVASRGRAPGRRVLGDRRLPAPLAPLEPSPPRRRRVLRGLRIALGSLGAAAVLLGAVAALHRIGADELAGAVARSSPGWTVAAFAVMALSLLTRAVAWRALLSAAIPDGRPCLRDAYQGTAIGVLMSATLPARLGEPARALVVARRLGRPREHLPGIAGTLVAQTALNVLALVLLAAVVLGGPGPWRDGGSGLTGLVAPVVLVVAAVLVAPVLLAWGPPASPPRRASAPVPVPPPCPASAPVAVPPRRARRRRHDVAASPAVGVRRLRDGLRALAHPRLAPVAVTAQLTAWALQWLSCWLLLVALGVGGQGAPAAAAGVLLAVNVTALVPVTPSNVGVFQAACVAVLAAYGVGTRDALAYGIVLQAVELAVAVALGVPALVREGRSWRDVRTRALLAAPVRLAPRGAA